VPEDVYALLAAALDRLPNGFPRTPSGAEFPLLRHLFSPDEAALAVNLTGEFEPLETIAARLGLAPTDARRRLMGLVRRGFAWFWREGGTSRFRLAPFIVGFYEAQLDDLDEELARLVEAYMLDGGTAGIMTPQPALQRVVPARGTVKSEWVLPYEDVRAILEACRTFSVRDCICRVQQQRLGHACDAPVHNCLSFSPQESSDPNGLTLEQALAVLDEAEKAGLVHSVTNVAAGMGYMCNCCGCCCGVLRGITQFGIAESVAHANYYAVIDADTCLSCGICIDRCQVDAIDLGDAGAVVVRERCIGCGLCVSGCATGAARLERKPAADCVAPPADYGAWEQQRRRNRGLS
jgi:Na+-translocating ferredoxin:NAD+ oxidoreductase subunit B